MTHLASLRRWTSAGFLILAAGTLGAQSRKTGTLTGVVLDEQGVPVANVEVAVTKADRTTRTDSAGKYILALMPTGTYDVAFRRVSYSPMIFSIEITQGDTTEAEVRMNAAPQQMTTVRVDVRPEAVSHRLDGFESRRRVGMGHFVTRGQIEARNPLVLSDLVRTIPGTILQPAGMGRSVLRFSRSEGKGRDCAPTYYIDGVMASGYNLDEMPVSDVEAIELYAGLAGLPAEFAKTRGSVGCGTVAIWTRIPGKKK